ncbi:Ig-like domain-containing protein, partial [Salinicola halimionae]|uniref:Ig-like domain-containing protein n=1 Tax=Salinicola halimionae TaxID=1949081 RepID=UPI001FD9AC58
GGLEGGATWEYSTDGGDSWTTGMGSSFELPEGDYGADDVQVRQTDAAGNTGEAGELGAVTIDLTAPEVPVIEGAEDDVPPAGSIGGGDMTNDVTPTLIGSAEANAIVTVYADGRNLGTTTADGNGDWQFATDEEDQLFGGETVFTATATDIAGNVSATSPTFTLTFDTTAPAAPTIEPTNGDEITGTAEPGSTITLTGDGTPIGSVDADPDDGSWSFTPDDPLPDGTEVNATATDASGNVSPEATATVDATAPNADGNDIHIDDGGDGFLNVDEAGNVTLTGRMEGGASVTGLTISDSDGVIFDVTDFNVDADGNLTTTGINLSSLADGELTATLSVTDAAGNTGTVSDITTLDTAVPDAPTATLANDSGTEGDGVTNDATINIGGLESGATWEYSTDGGDSWTTGIGTSFELSEGDYVADAVQVRQTDAAGNTGEAGNLGAVTVDLTDPVAPTIFSATDDVDPTDTLDDGDTTNDATPTLTGSAEANTTVAILANGTQIGTADADDDGNWSFAIDDADALPDGDVDFTAVATDTAGNVSPASPTFTLTVDTTDPAAPIPTLANDTGDNAEDGITSDATVNVAGLEPGSTWEYSTDGGTIWNTGAGSRFELDAAPYDDGDILVRQTDVAGNTSDIGSLGPITVDQTDPAAPTIVSATDDVDPATDDLVNGDATNDATPTLTGTAEANTTVTIFQNGTELTSVTADADGNWAFTPATLDDGDYTFTARTADVAGNVSPVSTEFTLTVDTQAPAAPTLDATDGSPITGTAEPGATITLTVDDTVIGTATAGAQGNWSFSPDAPLADATMVNATATDAAGNVGPSASTTVDADLNDVTPPAPPTIEFAVDDVDPQTDDLADGDSTNDPLPVLQGMAEAGSTVAISLNGVEVDSVTADDQGNWSYALVDALPEGDAVFTATATDGNGNTSGASDSFTLTVDTDIPDAPTIDSATDDVDPTGTLIDGDSTNDATPTLTGTAEANATVTVSANGTQIGTAIADGDGNWSLTPENMDALADGETTFTATTTDVAGNASGTSNQFSLNIDTGTPTTPTPTLTTDTGTNGDGITSDATINVDNLEDGATWEYSTDGGTNWTTGSGTSFELPEGIYADGDVQVRQTDTAGNTSDTGNLGAVTIDATGPEAPTIVSATDDVDPTGPLADGDSTNDATPMLTGTAEANATVAILANGTQIGTVAADENG